MKQSVLFEPEITFPPSDKFLFDVCNSAPNHWNYKQSFYHLKQVILSKYAVQVGIARQIIDVKCSSCNGTGVFQRGVSCMRCDRGIYQRRTYFLRKYVMNGKGYYVPICYEASLGGITEEIKGYIVHDPIEGVHPNFAYAALMYKYDSQVFHMFIIQFQNKLSKYDWKKWGEISQGKANFIEALAAWYEVNLQTQDDLPF